ncbi:MAG TPA: hypothetical protein VGI46_21890 [Candidatus Acidoferrum sp.]
MSARKEMFAHVFGQTVFVFLAMLLCESFLPQPANSQQRNPQGDPASVSVASTAFVQPEPKDSEGTANDPFAIPAGTILPVRLNSTISSTKSRPGQVITGRIMQDVPLSPGLRIKAGARVVGHIVEPIPASTGAPARISLQFDKIISEHQTISMTTDLRAVAGFMRVAEAHIPPVGPGESDVYRWLTTVQIGGDVVYGEGGPVTSADSPNDVVGKKVNDGVLGQVRANASAKCQGAIDGNDNPQALWVFSSDACGTYGLEHISIAHAGRTDPIGVILLVSESGNLKIPGGAGMLLRVRASNHN